jgi:uncharacterized membrane protein YfcA
MAGAMLGGWIFTQAGAAWLGLMVGLFLVSTPFQCRLGGRARSFPMQLPWFIPVSVAVGLISGVVGASSLVSEPFYLNYGLTKERMIATGSVHSLFIQLTKIVTYGSLGEYLVLNPYSKASPRDSAVSLQSLSRSDGSIASRRRGFAD